MKASYYEFQSEDVASGMPGYILPLSVRFSPDGKKLTYLFPDQTGKRTIFALELSSSSTTPAKLFDTSTQSNEALSLEEQLRRERMRLFTDGISSYEWCSFEGKQYILIPLGGKLFLYDESKEDVADRCQMIYDGSLGAPIDPHLSPNGKSVAFVIKSNLYVHHFSALGATPIQVTFDGSDDGISYAVADYIAQEEMSRYRGFWWSPDSKQITMTVNDESHIPKYEILHQGKEDPTHAEHHRYPFAGKENPRVKLAVVDVPSVATGEAVPLTWMDLINASDARFQCNSLNTAIEFYVCRVGWWPDGSIMAQVQNRAQTVLQLLRIDPKTGKRSIILEETSDVWINLYDILTPLSKSFKSTGESTLPDGDFHFIWPSERSGYCQLYLYRYDSVNHKGINLTPDIPLSTGGSWVVESIEAIDEENGLIYFSGNYAAPTEKHLFRASLQPSKTVDETKFMRLTNMSGWHSCAVNAREGYFSDVFCNLNTPAVLRLHRFDVTTGLVDDSKTITIIDNLDCDKRLATRPQLFASILPPTIHTLRSHDDKVDLICSVYMPPGFKFESYLQGNKQLPAFPTIMSVYGGPHVQRVMNHWSVSADLRAQRMAQLGMVVIKCDNRGSYRRGLAFEGAIRFDMGNLEVQDQVRAVEYFSSLGLVDPARVGMFGWSYGGYMSAMSLCRAPDTFACAVAGAPVTSWDGYDTHYTERYMGHPDENVTGYHDSSVMTHVSKMKGKLMLVHGLIDENVHFRHTARLINKLIAERKRYELVMFPCERHSPHKLQDKIYIEDIMTEFFERCLVPTALPTLLQQVESAATNSPPVRMTAHL